MTNPLTSPIHLNPLQIISIGYFQTCLSKFTHISLVGHIFCPRSKIGLGWHLVRKINMCRWKAVRGSNSAFTLFSVSLDLMNLPRASKFCSSAICAVGFFTMVVAPTIFWGAGPMVLVFTIIPLVLVSSPPHNHHHQETLTASSPWGWRSKNKTWNLRQTPNWMSSLFKTKMKLNCELSCVLSKLFPPNIQGNLSLFSSFCVWIHHLLEEFHNAIMCPKEGSK